MRQTLLILFLLAGTCSYSQEQSKYTCYFAFGKYELPKDSAAALTRWFTQFKSPYAVTLSAFTDTIGTVAKNQVLAENRLNTVIALLPAHTGKNAAKKIVGENYSLENYSDHAPWRKVEITVSSTPEAPEESKKFETTDAKTIEKMETFAREKGPVRLDIQFVGGLPVYIGNSAQEVEILAEYLRQNPEVTAFIRGHVCCDNEMELSILRAYTVYSDLLRKGISKERLSYRGYGNTMPAMPEVDSYSRQQNRRVDVIFSRE